MSSQNAAFMPSTKANQKAANAMERRDFLKISVAASGGLLIGFQFPGVSKLASAETSSSSTFMPNAFVRIGTDERVTVIVNHSGDGAGRLHVIAHAARGRTRCRLEESWI